MSKPNECTDNFKSNLICIFPSVRAKLKKTLCPRTLCSSDSPARGMNDNYQLFTWQITTGGLERALKTDVLYS